MIILPHDVSNGSSGENAGTKVKTESDVLTKEVHSFEEMLQADQSSLATRPGDNSEMLSVPEQCHEHKTTRTPDASELHLDTGDPESKSTERFDILLSKPVPSAQKPTPVNAVDTARTKNSNYVASETEDTAITKRSEAQTKIRDDGRFTIIDTPEESKTKPSYELPLREVSENDSRSIELAERSIPLNQQSHIKESMTSEDRWIAHSMQGSPTLPHSSNELESSPAAIRGDSQAGTMRNLIQQSVHPVTDTMIKNLRRIEVMSKASFESGYLKEAATHNVQGNQEWVAIERKHIPTSGSTASMLIEPVQIDQPTSVTSLLKTNLESGALPNGEVEVKATAEMLLHEKISTEPIKSNNLLHQTGTTLRPSVHQQILPHLMYLLSSSQTGAAEISLQPEELGMVRMMISTTDTGVMVAISADRAETQELMKRFSSLLNDDLKSLGFGDVDLSFSSRRDDPGANLKDQVNVSEVTVDSGHLYEIQINPTEHSNGLDLSKRLDVRI